MACVVFQDDGNGNECRINNLPDDILVTIITELNLTDFVRLKCTCKTLNKACEQLIQTRNNNKSNKFLRGVQHPWLLLPKTNINNNASLAFYDMFEDKIRSITLPSLVRGGWCCSSCRGGWVPITKAPPVNQQPKPVPAQDVYLVNPKPVPAQDVFLVNPITGECLTLPPLNTIPKYSEHVRVTADPSNASLFVHKLDFSGSSPTEPGSIIAGLFYDPITIAFCKVGAKSWTIADEEIKPDIDLNEIHPFDILFSVDGTTLYATATTMTIISEDNYPAIQTKNLSLLFHDEQDNIKVHSNNILFKCIIPKFIKNIEDKLEQERIISLGKDASLTENSDPHSYLLWTSKGKLSIVLKTVGLFSNEMMDNPEYEYDRFTKFFLYKSTNGFKVFSLDSDLDEEVVCADELTKLEYGVDDVIFVGSGCFSMSSRHITTTRTTSASNSIFFFDDFTHVQPRFRQHVVGYMSRETGLFDLHTQRVHKCFPSFPLPMLSRMLWFTPSF